MRIGWQLATIEGWPVDEQEESSNEGEDVGHVVRLVIGGGGRPAEDEGHREAEVCSEHVRLNRSSRVEEGNGLDQNGLVDGVEHALEDRHDDQLQRIHLADDRTVRNQEGGDQDQADVDGLDVEVDAVKVVLVQKFRTEPLA